MTRVKLDQETMGISSIMERITRAKVIDCFKDDDNTTLYFVVAPGEMGRALGKGGSNVKKAEQELGKKVRVIEYNDSIETFVKNIIAPLRVQEIVLEGDIVYLKDSNKKTKSLLIGRESRNLNLISRAVRRFFNVNVKVV